MKTRFTERLNVKKAARFTVAINAMQVAAMIAVLVYTVLHAPTEGRHIEIAAIAVALLIVTWGAILDIREALNADRIVEQAQMLEECLSFFQRIFPLQVSNWGLLHCRTRETLQICNNPLFLQ